MVACRIIASDAQTEIDVADWPGLLTSQLPAFTRDFASVLLTNQRHP